MTVSAPFDVFADSTASPPTTVAEVVASVIVDGVIVRSPHAVSRWVLPPGTVSTTEGERVSVACSEPGQSSVPKPGVTVYPAYAVDWDSATTAGSLLHARDRLV